MESYSSGVRNGCKRRNVLNKIRGEKTKPNLFYFKFQVDFVTALKYWNSNWQVGEAKH